jgi:hypothetical protein
MSFNTDLNFEDYPHDDLVSGLQPVGLGVSIKLTSVLKTTRMTILYLDFNLSA